MDKQKIDENNSIQKKKLNEQFKLYKPIIKKNQRKGNESLKKHLISINKLYFENKNKSKKNIKNKKKQKCNYIYKSILNIFLLIAFIIISLHFKEYTNFYELDNIKGSIKVGFWIPKIKYGGRESNSYFIKYSC